MTERREDGTESFAWASLRRDFGGLEISGDCSMVFMAERNGILRWFVGGCGLGSSSPSAQIKTAQKPVDIILRRSMDHVRLWWWHACRVVGQSTVDLSGWFWSDGWRNCTSCSSWSEWKLDGAVGRCLRGKRGFRFWTISGPEWFGLFDGLWASWWALAR